MTKVKGQLLFRGRRLEADQDAARTPLLGHGKGVILDRWSFAVGRLYFRLYEKHESSCALSLLLCGRSVTEG
jgi:hypothetical protein